MYKTSLVERHFLPTLSGYVVVDRGNNYVYCEHHSDASLSVIAREWEHTVTYFKDGKSHNPNPETPAEAGWHPNGLLAFERWKLGGKLDDPNPDTPAVRIWGEGGEIVCEESWKNGVLRGDVP